MADPTLKGVLNANNPRTLLSGSNLNALANNALVLGSAFSNVKGDGEGEGFARIRLKLHLDSMTVATNGVFSLWILSAADGSVYEQGGTSYTPMRPPDYVFTPIAQTLAVDLEGVIQAPLGATLKALLKNEATGAATPSNTNGYLKAYYETDAFPQV